MLLISYAVFLCFSSVSSVTQPCPTLFDPWTAVRRDSLSITNSRSLFKLMSIESVMPFNHLTFCHPLLLLPSIFPSIRAFFKVSVLMRCPKYWRFSFSISPSSKYSGLISFRIDLFDLLVVHGMLKSPSPAPQFESINSLALNILYSLTLTSIPDYWKNHSFDYTGLCQRSSLCFLICCLDWSWLFFQGANVFNY